MSPPLLLLLLAVALVVVGLLSATALLYWLALGCLALAVLVAVLDRRP